MPVYRQEKNVVRYLRALGKVLAGLNVVYEMICVVDGQVDNTYENAKKAKIPKLKVFTYPKNQGKGNAVRFGMSRARGEVIGFVDGGFDLKYSSIPLALEHMKWYNADIMIGSKRHPASKVTYPWQRRILSWGYQMGVRLLFGINVRDSQVGIKFFKRKVVKEIMPKLLIKAFAFDIEMLAVANRMGFSRIYEFPIELKLEFGTSSIASIGFFKTSWNMLWDTLAVFYRLKIRCHYDK
ncbi:MAG: Glycosyl transferase, family 2 [Candidatus Amesbacteria bacterium GW2011_GWB1_47_26]|uniref:Glycosyl transferase, family 2 n=1 Tax=Candidatus Amesbacteria bacterium GW2011_GWC2_45_19 TaxID=1618366 RepID=A0A0G1M5E9_9BACT|nr:MAG: Glycosyl transferase, family 2 [Candidatus Amesbacteria bacterium GW2011_GWC2_45_19]KKU38293.1 MAG: Glycosyl transferase, family 2 [Candidatus Amesbacteria bacterium GW2011_GWA1_46_35]KKU69518.1 MAG: Glycosyl transferase, family 2 [Microgenomates group bacterium GW2011_GWC1_47_20]KKU74869.1 MAG: Glycosyl transferase, family 2 [Candidatus Amesbacteria bacterium GW2011_GWB1_47_26]KKU80341.1 MAG: Glycosyl transferase, family 2 [Candidatus Amesbacteria bacterium GW2011_GWA2_47_70]